MNDCYGRITGLEVYHSQVREGDAYDGIAARASYELYMNSPLLDAEVHLGHGSITQYANEDFIGLVNKLIEVAESMYIYRRYPPDITVEWGLKIANDGKSVILKGSPGKDEANAVLDSLNLEFGFSPIGVEKSGAQ